jgi:ATP-dependent Clp protease ATP-binding subunit ClpC
MKNSSNEIARIFNIAQEKARQLGHNYIGTEHIIFGILSTDNEIRSILEDMDINANVFESEIINIVGTNSKAELSSEINISARVKRVIELSYEEARVAGEKDITPVFLMLGIIKEGEGIGVHILEKLGVSLSLLKKDIINVIKLSKTMKNFSSSNQSSTNSMAMRELESMGTNLIELAKADKLDPVIGRENEISRMIQILVRRKKNNPVLIGEPGVGKTSIVEGLAIKIANGNVPRPLRNTLIFSIDLASVVSGTKYRGEFEKRLKKLISVAKNMKNVILYFDEFHTIVGAGAAEGALDASNILKPSLAKGEIKVIGSTTFDEFRKRIEKDGALDRRLQKVIVNEPDIKQTLAILNGIKHRYEKFHNVIYEDESIEEAVKLSNRYIIDRYQPDKSIDILDESGAMVRLRNLKMPVEIQKLEKKLKVTALKKIEAINNQDFAAAAKYKDEETKIQGKLNKMIRHWENDEQAYKWKVFPEDVRTVVSKWANLPLNKMQEDENEKLLNMEKELHKYIVGQNKAIETVSKAIRRSKTGIKDPKKPIGTFLFVGPTGVGKTEVARVLAKYLFGSEEHLIRLDMSEYMEKFDVTKLIGAPPGYVGYDEAGELTEAVKKKPFSVILFDEIEKAHPDVYNILLQIMDDGRLTDSHGRLVDFKNTIIILTSNIAGQYINKEKISLGFSKNDNNNKNMEELLDREVKKVFKPEFLNRLDELVVFHMLNKDEIREIIDIVMQDFVLRLLDRKMGFEITDDAKELVISEGYSEVYGARPLKRAIQRLIEDPLAEELLKNRFKERDIIIADRNNDKIVFKKSRKKLKATVQRKRKKRDDQLVFSSVETGVSQSSKPKFKK